MPERHELFVAIHDSVAVRTGIPGEALWCEGSVNHRVEN